MRSINSTKKKFFEDRSIAIRPGIIYNATNGSYVASSVPTSVKTAATQRLGTITIVADDDVDKQLENVGYPIGGTSVGSVTVFTGSISEQSAEDLIDFYRTGKNIKNFKLFISR